MNPTKQRSYRATFILDNRGRQETVEQLVEGVKKEITAIQGEITAVDTIGRKDFVRVTDRKFTAGSYVQVTFNSAPEGPAQLKERLRLNNSVHSTFVQLV